MPIDYKRYHPQWKGQIVPDILKRANNCCEVCGIANKEYVFRGYIEVSEIEVYQTSDGCIYDADNSKKLFDEEGFGIVIIPLSRKLNDVGKVIRIVLTIAHLDHDIANNDYSNLKAMCQLHHNRYDAKNRAKNKTKSRKGLIPTQ